MREAVPGPEVVGVVILVLPVDDDLDTADLVDTVQLGRHSALVEGEGVGIELAEGLLEVELVGVPEEEVAEGGDAVGVRRVAAGVDDTDDSLDHLELSYPASRDYTAGVVPVHPDLYHAALVHPDVLLLHLEAPVLARYCAEAGEHLLVEVQAVWEGICSMSTRRIGTFSTNTLCRWLLAQNSRCCRSSK